MVALTRDGRIAIWGEKSDTLNPPLPVNDTTIANIVAARDMVLIQYVDGSVKIWDSEFHSFDDFIKPGQARIVQMAANLRSWHGDWYKQFIVLDDNGHVYTDDRRWELDFGSDSDVEPGTGHIIPAAVQGNTSAVFVDKHHVYAVQKDPTVVYAWGGHTARVFRTTKPVKQIVGDGDYTFFLYQDGTVSADGPAKFQPPAHLGPVKSIAASDTHILALLEDGTVVAWGDNELGACDVPADLGPVVQVAVGDDFSVVLCTDGSVRGWGEDGEGQYAFPADLPKVRQISTSFYETYVLTESGSVIKSHRPSIFDVPDALRV
jgi:alpha-tubulin suppressor-like RCC1 family protein